MFKTTNYANYTNGIRVQITSNFTNGIRVQIKFHEWLPRVARIRSQFRV